MITSNVQQFISRDTLQHPNTSTLLQQRITKAIVRVLTLHTPREMKCPMPGEHGLWGAGTRLLLPAIKEIT